jgi:hypothetical protein
MKALVVYESMFGNSATVARAVAEGLSRHADVTLVEARTMPSAAEADLIVIGGPTHALGLSRPATRADAVRQGAPAPDGPGLREWLDTAPAVAGAAVAAFDTRVSRRLVGSAGRKAHRHLRRLGGRPVAPPESFLVGSVSGPLLDGEVARAGDWGEVVAQAALLAMSPA